MSQTKIEREAASDGIHAGHSSHFNDGNYKSEMGKLYLQKSKQSNKFLNEPLLQEEKKGNFKISLHLANKQDSH